MNGYYSLPVQSGFKRKPSRLNSLSCAIIYALHGVEGIKQAALLSAYLAK
jgi:hypothetical protein